MEVGVEERSIRNIMKTFSQDEGDVLFESKTVD